MNTKQAANKANKVTMLGIKVAAGLLDDEAPTVESVV